MTERNVPTSHCGVNWNWHNQRKSLRRVWNMRSNGVKFEVFDEPRFRLLEDFFKRLGFMIHQVEDPKEEVKNEQAKG